jgi:dTDP-4-amino-4,6-dideoxygalactose transaminase
LGTFNFDTEQIERSITPKTVGIIPVHLFGLCADLNPILEIAKKHQLWVVEDAACGFGAYYHGRHAGTFGEMGCFSFHPRKSITTGEGGMITTAKSEIDRLSRMLRDHGASRTDLDRNASKSGFLLSDYNHLGYNYRMTDIQGALGCAQMERAKWILEEKSKRARLYDQMLENMNWLKIPAVPDGYIHGYQAYVCLFHPEVPTIRNAEQLSRKRNDLMRRLEEKGIATRQGTHAPVIQGYYVEKYGLRPDQFSKAYLADRLSLTLPLYVQMTEGEQEMVCQALRKEFENG